LLRQASSCCQRLIRRLMVQSKTAMDGTDATDRRSDVRPLAEC
jgi:hypothetical protein